MLKSLPYAKVNQNDAIISVEAEDHQGSIVMLADPYEFANSSQDEEGNVEDEVIVPLDGDTVVVPESPEIADYLYRRKLVTVNGEEHRKAHHFFPNSQNPFLSRAF